MSDINQVIPSEQENVTVSSGKTFTVSELTARDIPKVLRLLAGCDIRVTGEGFDILSAYSSDEFFQMLELLVGDSVAELTFDDLMLVTGKVFEVNRVFFALAVMRATARQQPTPGPMDSNF